LTGCYKEYTSKCTIGWSRKGDGGEDMGADGVFWGGGKAR